MADVQHSSMDGGRGSITVHSWDLPDPRWIAVLVHGYGEHLGRYPHVAARLNSAGAMVVGPDHEGHGLSAGDRVSITDFETVVDDLDAVINVAVGRHPDLPVIMIGHSMGGMIAARYAQRHRDRLAALVLSGPVLGSWYPTELIDAEVIPDEPLDVSTLSRDDRVGQVYAADPLVWHGPFKRELLRALDRILDVINNGGDLGDLPTLWVHGEADTLVPIGPSRAGIDRIRGSELREIIYPEARHEVFNETNQEQVLHDVINFVGPIVDRPERRILSPGMVSYTYRNEFQQDVSATLDRIRDLGITDLEFSSLFDHSAAELRRLLDERGLRCSSYGVGLAALDGDLDGVAAEARTLGAAFVRVAWLPHEAPFDRADAESAVRTFNRVGAALRDHGLTFCYHNHGYEFVPHGEGTLFDLIVQGTDPEAVAFELDILWAHFPGADPAQLLRAYPDRFRLMHLKDLRRGVVGDLTGQTAKENDVALGDGQLNLPEILEAAGRSAISHYYIEDESPSIATQVPRSLAYLAALAAGAPRR